MQANLPPHQKMLLEDAAKKRTKFAARINEKVVVVLIPRGSCALE